MKRVWDEKLGPSRHLKREADIPLSHHNWLTGGPGSGDGEVLQKSMFPESSVKGEYMFLDFINKYFIQLSMACMWWKRTLSCHSGFRMGRWYVCRKIEATKGYQQEWAEKTPIWMMGKELNCVFVLSWYDCWGCPAELEWRLTTISGGAVTGRPICNTKKTLVANFTADHRTYQPHQNSRQDWYCKATSTHICRSNMKQKNTKLPLHKHAYPAETFYQCQ